MEREFTAKDLMDMKRRAKAGAIMSVDETGRMIEAYMERGAMTLEIERLRARVAELEETVRFSEDQRRMLFDAAKKLEADRDRLQSLANVYRTEVMARRNERAAFFSRTMKYEEWQAASRQVEIARADTDAARAANGEVGG